MKLTDEQYQEIENFAGINYSPRDIAVILEVNINDFLQEFDDINSSIRLHYDRGQLLANATIRKNIVDSAKSSIAAAQEYSKMIKNDQLEAHKRSLDASAPSVESEFALVRHYKDSLDHYIHLQDLVHSGSNFEGFPEQIQDYWIRLDTAHNIFMKFGNREKGLKYCVNLIKTKFPDISIKTAYRYINEAVNFFGVDLSRDNWRKVLAEDLEKAKSLAWELNRPDWFIKAIKEQAEMLQLKQPEQELIDPELLKERILLIVDDPGLLGEDVQKINPKSILDKIKEYEISMEDKIRIAKDAGIQDVDFEEIFDNGEDNE